VNPLHKQSDTLDAGIVGDTSQYPALAVESPTDDAVPTHCVSSSRLGAGVRGMDWLPNGVRLTTYSGEAADLTSPELQSFLDAVAEGRARVPTGRVYRMDEVIQAHTDMESGAAGGKLVVVPR